MNENHPIVSVVIPSYNSGSTIIQAIESVFNQSYKSWEVIVVDDGSTDDTYEILEGLIRDNRISYIRQDNRGCGTARNNGLRHAKGEYVGFLDADDYFHVEKLERQMARFAENEECIVSYTDAYEIDPYQQAVWDVRQTKAGRLRTGHVLPYLAFRNFITLSSAVVRKSAFDAVLGFEERYDLMMFADYDLWLKLAPIGAFSAVEMPLTFYQTRHGITRRQKRDNHRKVMTVFWNRFVSARTVDKFWYAVGFKVSCIKYLAHATLLLFHL